MDPFQRPQECHVPNHLGQDQIQGFVPENQVKRGGFQRALRGGEPAFLVGLCSYGNAIYK